MTIYDINHPAMGVPLWKPHPTGGCALPRLTGAAVCAGGGTTWSEGTKRGSWVTCHGGVTNATWDMDGYAGFNYGFISGFLMIYLYGCLLISTNSPRNTDLYEFLWISMDW